MLWNKQILFLNSVACSWDWANLSNLKLYWFPPIIINNGVCCHGVRGGMAGIDHLNDGQSKIHALQMMEKVTKKHKKSACPLMASTKWYRTVMSVSDDALFAALMTPFSATPWQLLEMIAHTFLAPYMCRSRASDAIVRENDASQIMNVKLYS